MSSEGKVCYGKVSLLYAYSKGVHVKVVNEKGQRSLNDYYALSKDHPNYDALYALVLASAADGRKVTLRCADKIEKDKYTEIIYITVAF